MEQLAKQIGCERRAVANELDHTLMQQRHHAICKYPNLAV
jgi:hypothetical protein